MLDKGYVILNKSEDCMGCEWNSCGEIGNYGTCILDEKRRGIICKKEYKPDWCPIKEFPRQKYQMDEYDDWEYGYCAGYNVCLEEIKGE